MNNGNSPSQGIPADTIAPPSEKIEPRRDGYTCGTWTREADSCAALDRAIEATDDFLIYKEVVGQSVQPQLGVDKQRFRIDRVLFPTAQLMRAGWTHGPIGIECKASGKRIGPALAQLFDYSRSVWLPNPATGTWIMLQWLFLWPVNKTSSTVASVMAQHRVGSAEPRNGGLKLACGESVLYVNDQYGQRLGKGNHGLRAGSR